ncbi:unnamed protein product [Closterium sp. NIES-53]
MPAAVHRSSSSSSFPVPRVNATMHARATTVPRPLSHSLRFPTPTLPPLATTAPARNTATETPAPCYSSSSSPRVDDRT